jgi:hypothetical protein
MKKAYTGGGFIAPMGTFSTSGGLTSAGMLEMPQL